MAKKPTTPAPAADQPYYLQRAHIKDFRSIRDAVVEFKPGLNIIIGANGSGKTNFIRCVKNILGKPSADFNADFSLSIKGRADLLVESVKPDLKLLKSFQINDLVSDKQKVIKLSFSDKNIEASSFPIAQLHTQTGLNKETSHWYFLRIIPIEYGTPTNYPLVNTSEDFYVSATSVSYPMYEESFFAQSFASSLSQLFVSEIISQDRKNLVTHEEAQEIINKVESFYISAINSATKLFSPIDDIRLTASYNTYTNSAQQHVIIKGIFMEFKIAGDWLPFSSLSSGTQRLFYIISEAITAGLQFSASKLSPLNFIDNILLLEEPELGIHPHQLHLLLNFLREQSEKHQLIITTHSPQVLDMLREDELDRITICELHKTKGTQFRKLKKTQLADAKRYMREVGFLSDYWRMGDLEAAK